MTDSWLCTDHIDRSKEGVEYHPLRPFLPAHARVLFLGSFPPPRRRWCMDFYYPNFINDHWRIEGEVFYGDRHHFVADGGKRFDQERIVAFCRQQGLAFYDTATAVRRLKDNASDEQLEVVEPTDVRRLLAQLPCLEAVVTTGQKATSTLCASFGLATLPGVGCSVELPGVSGGGGRPLRLYRLPSSSRAYPLPFERKAAAYRAMFSSVGLLPPLLRYDLGDGVAAFSTTRQGGSGEGPYAGFNINRYCGDSEAHVAEGRRALCRQLGISDDRLLMPHQTHGTRVALIDSPFMALPAAGRAARLEGVDALMTRLPGVCIGVSTADCIPLLLYDPEHRAACAVHAGWRGTAARIAEAAVAAMSQAFGSRPAALRAQIGPGISLDSFEVGAEVYEAFAAQGFDMAAVSRRYPSAADPSGERWHIDLPACNRQQLVASGLAPAAIADSGVCTYRHYRQFFSARRLGTASGRIFTGIML